jgi:hypothetical protein
MKRVSWGGIALMSGILGILLIVDLTKPQALIIWLIASLVIYFVFSHE